MYANRQSTSPNILVGNISSVLQNPTISNSKVSLVFTSVEENENLACVPFLQEVQEESSGAQTYSYDPEGVLNPLFSTFEEHHVKSIWGTALSLMDSLTLGELNTDFGLLVKDKDDFLNFLEIVKNSPSPLVALLEVTILQEEGVVDLTYSLGYHSGNFDKDGEFAFDILKQVTLKHTEPKSDQDTDSEILGVL